MALLELVGVGRRYDSGGGSVDALRDVNLRVQAGEMLAIMGASGSGKSTLMNVLGCLDVATAGKYCVAGKDTARLDADALAALRRERFGFIFQRYHLLTHQSALANVEMPAIYAGLPAVARRPRARELLARLGLADRCTHRPPALSGGQQQRVSIARALMNGGEVILADEPTGALDSASGREMMAVLKELHGRGHTVILVTHDAQVAAHAPRVVELSDGRIVRDTGWPAGLPRAVFEPAGRPADGAWVALWRRGARLADAVRMALDALRSHRLRSALSVLGISIGIAAVVSIVALSDAARATVDAKLRGFLSGRLMVIRGNPRLGPGVQALAFRPQDIAALRAVPGVSTVAPEKELTVTARHQNRNGEMTLFGVQPGELGHLGVKLVEGRDLNAIDLVQRAQFVVLNQKARDRLFEPKAKPIGQTIFVGPLPFIVVGLTSQGGGALDVGGGWRDTVFAPATTFDDKVRGNAEISRLDIYMDPATQPQQVQAAAQRVLQIMHGREDFNFFSLDDEFRQIERVTLVLKLVLAAIAAISLLVGGVGVMNIMLVAVSERTPEIGIRMAVGARRGDVQTQFLVEAIVLCAAGSLVGVALPWLAALAANALQHDVQLVVSWAALGVAFFVASAIGISFGFLPARQAARLSPVQALARE